MPFSSLSEHFHWVLGEQKHAPHHIPPLRPLTPHPGPPFSRAFSPTPHYGCHPCCCADGPPNPPPPLLCGPGAWAAGRESSEQKGVATFQVPPLNTSGQWPRPLPASPPALRSKPTQPGSLGEWTLLQPHCSPRTKGCTQLPFRSWLLIPRRACPLIPPI